MPIILIRDLITDALVDTGEVGQGQGISPEDGAKCLRMANLMLKMWARKRLFLFNVDTYSNTLTANDGDYTMGPEAGNDFIAERPILIESAVPIIPGSTHRMPPLNILTAKQWAAYRGKSAQDLFPIDLYYDRTYNAIGLHFRPIPTQAVPFELFIWNELAEFADLDAEVNLPGEYAFAIEWNLAKYFCPGYLRPVTPDIAQNAAEGLQAIAEMNAQVMGGAFGESRTLNAPAIGSVQPLASPAQGPQQ